MFSLINIQTYGQEEIMQETESATNTIEKDEPLVFPRIDYLFSSQFLLTVPNPVANKAFRKTFVGIYEVGGSITLSVFKNIFIGATFSNLAFKVDNAVIQEYRPVINIKETTPRVIIYNAAVSVGADFRLGVSNRIIFSTTLSAGQSYVKYNDFICKDPGKSVAITDFKAPYFGATASLCFLVQPNWGIGPTLGYSIVQQQFDPHALCLDDWESYPATNEGVTQYIKFGFVVYYNFFPKD